MKKLSKVLYLYFIVYNLNYIKNIYIEIFKNSHNSIKSKNENTVGHCEAQRIFKGKN